MEIKHNPERFAFDIKVTQPEQYLAQMRNASREVIDRAIRQVAAREEKNAEQAMILLLHERLDLTLRTLSIIAERLDQDLGSSETVRQYVHDTLNKIQEGINGTSNTPRTKG